MVDLFNFKKDDDRETGRGIAYDLGKLSRDDLPEEMPDYMKDAIMQFKEQLNEGMGGPERMARLTNLHDGFMVCMQEASEGTKEFIEKALADVPDLKKFLTRYYGQDIFAHAGMPLTRQSALLTMKIVARMIEEMPRARPNKIELEDELAHGIFSDVLTFTDKLFALLVKPGVSPEQIIEALEQLEPQEESSEDE